MSSFAQGLVTAVGASPYTAAYIDEINKNKTALDGKLFFEELLETLANIDNKVEQLYPPKNLEGTLLLVQKIEDSIQDSNLAQAAIIYYVFLDYPKELTQNIQLSSYFAREIDLPKGHQKIITGYWYLDHSKVDTALPYLSHPEASASSVDKLLPLLSSLSSRKLVAYIASKNPELVSHDMLALYITALCDSSKSLFSALQFMRSVSPDSQSDVLASIVNYALQSNKVRRLANLPLTVAEEKLLERILNDTLLHTDAQTAEKVKDVLLMRYLWGSKDLKAARKLASMGNSNSLTTVNTATAYMTWDDVNRGLQNSLANDR